MGLPPGLWAQGKRNQMCSCSQERRSPAEQAAEAESQTRQRGEGERDVYVYGGLPSGDRAATRWGFNKR